MQHGLNESEKNSLQKEDATWQIAGLGKVAFACFTYYFLIQTRYGLMKIYN